MRGEAKARPRQAQGKTRQDEARQCLHETKTRQQTKEKDTEQDKTITTNTNARKPQHNVTHPKDGDKNKMTDIKTRQDSRQKKYIKQKNGEAPTIAERRCVPTVSGGTTNNRARGCVHRYLTHTCAVSHVAIALSRDQTSPPLHARLLPRPIANEENRANRNKKTGTDRGSKTKQTTEEANEAQRDKVTRPIAREGSSRIMISPRGSGQDVFEISQVGSDRIGSGRVGSSRVTLTVPDLA